MSSRLNPREYDVVELRDALKTTRGRNEGSKDDCDTNQQRFQTESEELEDKVWVSASDVGLNETFEDDSGASESRKPAAAETASFSATDEARHDAEGVMTPKRDEHSADDRSDARPPYGHAESPRDSQVNPTTDGSGGLEREPSRLSTGSGDPELIPLDQLPNSFTGQMAILDWLEELLSVCSHEEAINAMDYYRSIGWLSDESYEQLQNYIGGLESATPADPEPLGIEHHRESLRHIAALTRLR